MPKPATMRRVRRGALSRTSTSPSPRNSSRLSRTPLRPRRQSQASRSRSWSRLSRTRLGPRRQSQASRSRRWSRLSRILLRPRRRSQASRPTILSSSPRLTMTSASVQLPVGSLPTVDTLSRASTPRSGTHTATPSSPALGRCTPSPSMSSIASRASSRTRPRHPTPWPGTAPCLSRYRPQYAASSVVLPAANSLVRMRSAAPHRGPARNTLRTYSVPRYQASPTPCTTTTTPTPMPICPSASRTATSTSSRFSPPSLTRRLLPHSGRQPPRPTRPSAAEQASPNLPNSSRVPTVPRPHPPSPQAP